MLGSRVGGRGEQQTIALTHNLLEAVTGNIAGIRPHECSNEGTQGIRKAKVKVLSRSGFMGLRLRHGVWEARRLLLLCVRDSCTRKRPLQLEQSFRVCCNFVRKGLRAEITHYSTSC